MYGSYIFLGVFAGFHRVVHGSESGKHFYWKNLERSQAVNVNAPRGVFL